MPPLEKNIKDYQHKTISVSEYETLKRDLETATTALKLVQHATAPTHDDGAHHENAFDISSKALNELGVPSVVVVVR